MESILAAFTVCLTLAFLASELFYRLKYPRVVGQILAGVILGLPFIKIYFGENFLSFVSSMADIGIVFLLLLVGTEVNIHNLLKVSKNAFILAILGYILPLIAGFFLMTLIGYNPVTSMIVGICLAISAEAITVETLMEYKMLHTRLGSTIMEAGMLDDFIGVISLSAVIGVVHGEGLSVLKTIPGEFMTFIIISYIIGFTILPRAAKAVWKEKSEAAVFSLAVIFGLIIVLLSQSFGLNSVVGAFIAGVIIQLSIKNKREEKEIVDNLRVVTFGLVIPFFFMFIGLNFDVYEVLQNLPFVIILTAVALIGKLSAPYVLAKFNIIKSRDVSLIGWGINPRGAVELIIASIALENGLISKNLFSAIVAMAVIAAIVSPIMFKKALEKKKGYRLHH